MTDASFPVGGVTTRKYAALCLALGIARGGLSGAIEGEDVQETRHILDITTTARIAAALGAVKTIWLATGVNTFHRKRSIASERDWYGDAIGVFFSNTDLAHYRNLVSFLRRVEHGVCRR